MKKSIFILLVLYFFSVCSVLSQETCTLVSATADLTPLKNADWSCTGGVSNPGDFVDAANEGIVIIPNGTVLTISKSATWYADITVESGGQIVFENQLNLGDGTQSPCPYELTIESGGNIVDGGGGANDRLIVCGNTIISSSPNPPAGSVEWPADGSGFDGPLTAGENGLPVELIYFEGANRNDLITLEWATSDEENFHFFEIQRSSDAVNFYTLGEVEGIGARNAITNYSFTDEAPLAGVNYYRLKANDFDGTFEYHKIIGVEYNGDHNRKLTVYPNPVSNSRITIRTNFDFDQAYVRITDSNGKEVFSAPQEFPAQTFQLPQSLNPGLYFVEMNSSKGQYTFKLIKE